MSMAAAESVMVKWPNTLFVLCLILEEENGACCVLRVGGTLRKVKDVCCGVFVKVLKTKRLRRASTLTKVSVNGQMKDQRKILLTALEIALYFVSSL